jgi:hypothetical protein
MWASTKPRGSAPATPVAPPLWPRSIRVLSASLSPAAGAETPPQLPDPPDMMRENDNRAASLSSAPRPDAPRPRQQRRQARAPPSPRRMWPQRRPDVDPPTSPSTPDATSLAYRPSAGHKCLAWRLPTTELCASQICCAPRIPRANKRHHNSPRSACRGIQSPVAFFADDDVDDLTCSVAHHHAIVEVCVKAASGKPDTLGDCECFPPTPPSDNSARIPSHFTDLALLCFALLCFGMVWMELEPAAELELEPAAGRPILVEGVAHGGGEEPLRGEARRPRQQAQMVRLAPSQHSAACTWCLTSHDWFGKVPHFISRGTVTSPW